MKKLVLLPAIAALSLGLAACSKHDDAGNASVGNDTAFNSTDVVTDENISAFDGNAGSDAGLTANGTDANGLDTVAPADNATANTL